MQLFLLTLFTNWLPKISFYLDTYRKLIYSIFLVGGSPNHQDPVKMEAFLTGLRRHCGDSVDIYAFCGDGIEDVQEVLKKHCDYIKVGAYIPELTCDNNYQYGIKLATSNQMILKKGIDY